MLNEEMNANAWMNKFWVWHPPKEVFLNDSFKKDKKQAKRTSCVIEHFKDILYLSQAGKLGMSRECTGLAPPLVPNLGNKQPQETKTQQF